MYDALFLCSLPVGARPCCDTKALQSGDKLSDSILLQHTPKWRQLSGMMRCSPSIRAVKSPSGSALQLKGRCVSSE